MVLGKLPIDIKKWAKLETFRKEARAKNFIKEKWWIRKTRYIKYLPIRDT
jgi:hypothetical protein